MSVNVIFGIERDRERERERERGGRKRGREKEKEREREGVERKAFLIDKKAIFE